MSKKAAHLEVKLPDYVRPTDDTTNELIRKFLKLCSKESLVQYLYEKCSYTRRFTKKSVVERQKRMKYRRNAQKHNVEVHSEREDAPKKKKKNVNKHQRTEKAQ